MGKLSQEQINFWIAEINSCEERQRQELRERNLYPLLIDYYEGLQAAPDSKKKLCIINEYFPNTNALISELMYQNPELIVDATKPEAEENAPLMKSALTYGFKKLDAITENKLALFDMLFAGYCAVEVNHINIKPESFTSQFAKPMDEAYQGNFFEKSIDKIKELFGNKQDGTKEEIETQLEKTIPAREEGYATTDETYLKRWNPLDIGFDYRAERIKDLRYIYKKIKLSKAEFNARYPDFKEKINASDTLPYTFHKNDFNKKTVTLYEIQIYLGEGKAVNIIISKDYVQSEIDYFERPFIHNGFNVKIGTLHEYGKLYPISFARINKAIQDDTNRYVTFMMEVAERNIPKRGYNKNKVKDDGLSALNNSRVNEAVPIDGGAENVWEIPATKVSLENKELLQLWQQHKEKTWNVSESRLLGRSQSEFATEMQIQEAGFESRQIDLQQGLRKLIIAELDCLKDIIVQFWDDAFFFKITGAPKPSWYIPQIDPVDGKTIMNPLTDILTADYEIDVDITSALRPNKQQKKKELIEFAQWITSPQTIQFLQMQGKMIDVEVIKKVASEWGWNPETLLIDLQPQPQLPMGAELGVTPNAPL